MATAALFLGGIPVAAQGSDDADWENIYSNSLSWANGQTPVTFTDPIYTGKGEGKWTMTELGGGASILAGEGTVNGPFCNGGQTNNVGDYWIAVKYTVEEKGVYKMSYVTKNNFDFGCCQLGYSKTTDDWTLVSDVIDVPKHAKYADKGVKFYSNEFELEPGTYYFANVGVPESGWVSEWFVADFQLYKKKAKRPPLPLKTPLSASLSVRTRIRIQPTPSSVSAAAWRASRPRLPCRLG